MSAARRAAWPWLAAAIVLIAAGGLMVRQSTAVPATAWMNMHEPGDFPTARDLASFVLGLRVPIPPVISALEISSHQTTGSSDLVTKHLYRATMVGSFVLATWLTYPSIARLTASLLASLVFLAATVALHPANPQVYDLFLPFCLLAFGLALRAAGSARAGGPIPVALGVAAGFFLSMAELARPFVLPLVPVAVFGAYLGLRRGRRGAFVALLVPLLAFSGLWHLNLFARHGQILSTNYAGFGLRRAWPQAPLGPTVSETSHRPADGERWPDLNTEDQAAASRYLQRAVLAYVLANPLDASRAAIDRVLHFSAPQVSMHGGAPPPPPLSSIYPLVARGAFLLLLANLVVLAWYAIRAPAASPHLLAAPDNLLILAAVFSVLALSLAEAGEEARLVLSVLPLLAAFPTARQPSNVR